MIIRLNELLALALFVLGCMFLPNAQAEPILTLKPQARTDARSIPGFTLKIKLRDGSSLAVYFHDDGVACLEYTEVLSCQAEWGLEKQTAWVYDPSLQTVGKAFVFQLDESNDQELQVIFRPYLSWALGIGYELKRGDTFNIMARAPHRVAIDSTKEAAWAVSSLRRETISAAQVASDHRVGGPMPSEKAGVFLTGRTMALQTNEGTVDVLYFATSNVVCTRIDGGETCIHRWKKVPPKALLMYHTDEDGKEVPDMTFSLVPMDGHVGVYAWMESRVLKQMTAAIFDGNAFGVTGTKKVPNPTSLLSTPPARAPTWTVDDAVKVIGLVPKLLSIFGGNLSEDPPPSSSTTRRVTREVCRTCYGQNIYGHPDSWPCQCHVEDSTE